MRALPLPYPYTTSRRLTCRVCVPRRALGAIRGHALFAPRGKKGLSPNCPSYTTALGSTSGPMSRYHVIFCRYLDIFSQARIVESFEKGDVCQKNQTRRCLWRVACCTTLATLGTSCTSTRGDEDRRQLDIALTDEGAQRARTLIDRRRRFEGACLACLTDEEQQSLIDMLDRLAEHWEQLEGEGACS